jgi:hypothetical protein
LLRLQPEHPAHGGADTVVSVRNGQSAAQGADAAGAVAGTVRSVQRGKRYEMAVTDFRQGRHTVAQLVEVGRLGHAWSGGAAGKPFSHSSGPDASRLAWSFMAKQLRE